MFDNAKIDSELLTPLSRANHQELERIVEYLDASPVIFIKNEKIYKENKNDLTKIYSFIAQKILNAGGHGLIGITVSVPSYKEIVLDICKSSKLNVNSFMTVRDLERCLLEWAFEKAKTIKNTNEYWDGEGYPPEKLAMSSLKAVIQGFKDPSLQATVVKSFKDANGVIKDVSKAVLDNIGPVINILNATKMSKTTNSLPGWVLSALVSISGLVEGISSMASTVGAWGVAAGGGSAAAGAATFGAAAYVGLIGVYAGLALAGPASAALFPCVYEIALLRLKE